MLILSTGYSSSLVSFFSVNVYPATPETFEDIAEMVAEQDLKVHVCCQHIIDAMEESILDSFKSMTHSVSVLHTVIPQLRIDHQR